MSSSANHKPNSQTPSASTSSLKHSNPFNMVSISFILIFLELTWRVVYIGQASNPAYDIVLEEAAMDCKQAGQLRFMFEVPAPQPNKLPEQDIVSVTAVLLTCSYKDNQEFLRVGYYVNVEYDNQEMIDNHPATPDISRLNRHILAEKPRVTKF